MGELRIHQEKVTPQIAENLISLCPFSAISYENGKLDISSACKMCRMCVRKGPAGVIEYVEEPKPAERTQQYYEKRPCPEMIAEAVRIYLRCIN